MINMLNNQIKLFEPDEKDSVDEQIGKTFEYYKLNLSDKDGSRYLVVYHNNILDKQGYSVISSPTIGVMVSETIDLLDGCLVEVTGIYQMEKEFDNSRLPKLEKKLNDLLLYLQREGD